VAQRNAVLMPPRLLPGDTIGVAAPASPFDRKRFERGVGHLRSAGFNVLVPKNLFLRNGYLAGSDAQRAQLLLDLFRDPHVKAILCARGGFGSMRILPLLDYDLIRARPKIVVGFSDVTGLLAALYARCRLVTFHGPVVAGLPDSDGRSRDALLSVMAGGTPTVISAPGGQVLRPGSGSGPVLAANLTTLCHLIGTPYMPPTRGHLLLLEDRGEAPYRVDRMLTQLRLAGYTRKIAGLGFGSFADCGRSEELTRVFCDHFSRGRFPVLTGLDIGHGRRNLTIPIGIPATLDADARRLTFHRAATV
jgi:muramoyltetrapeptide carboxypeptidase